MTKDEMLTKIIYKFGFENPYTIMFAEYLEQNNKKAEDIFEFLMKKSIEEN